MLFQAEPVDLGSYAQIAVFLAGSSLLATGIPTIAATRLDPALLLREK
jgi:hypothetical protein